MTEQTLPRTEPSDDAAAQSRLVPARTVLGFEIEITRHGASLPKAASAFAEFSVAALVA
jgi:hypothetical protein